MGHEGAQSALGGAAVEHRRALDCLPLLDGCQVHTTVMTSDVDRKIFKKLGIGLTSEPIRKD